MIGRSKFMLSLCGAIAVAAMSGAASAANPPDLVAAYTQQLVSQCGGTLTPALAEQLIRRVDLNGDKLDDWVVDAGAYPCPTRPAVFKDNGSQVTVFLNDAQGRGLPAFQRTAFGATIQGKPSTGYSLWLSMGGSDCDAPDAKARCERQVVWRADAKRLELASPDVKAKAAPKR